MPKVFLLLCGLIKQRQLENRLKKTNGLTIVSLFECFRERDVPIIANHNRQTMVIKAITFSTYCHD
ncbi:hypothetical protein SCAZ3_01305 [Streptococcus canis FSL Z3-227]|uniref:Transposase n=1 Tax=Streptococcus canis FSL Z3-227 TaxID=482234 RepID=A0AAV3FQ28_STRCB|nr:hypothetical protein SCAZ3_01305 [Streptococcus canis FSL Z3-227]